MATEGAPVLFASRAFKSSHPFSEIFPPPYRVLLLISLGVFCWAVNIHGLRILGLRPDDLLAADGEPVGLDSTLGANNSRVPTSSSAALPLHAHKREEEDQEGLLARRSDDDDGNKPARPSQSRAASSSNLHSSTAGPLSRSKATWLALAPMGTYALSALLALWTCFNWYLFRLYVSRRGDPSGRHAQAFQGVAVLAVVAALLWPGNVLYKGRRKQFGRSLLPLILPRPLLLRPPTFPAILLADVLTSFAKVFGDVWLTACFLVPRKEHHTWWNGRGSWVAPVLVSLPYGIRLLQCLAEYRHAGTALLKTAKRTKRPLANALKYASAFPVIWISASQSSRASGVPDQDTGGMLWNLWLLSVLVNSLFSFWWDVTNDWGLQVFKLSTWSSLASTGGVDHTIPPQLHRRGLSTWPAPSALANDRSSRLSRSSANGGLENTLYTKFLRPLNSGILFSPATYQVAILLDLVLRLTWSLKLSPHLAQLVELESGVFVLETLEIMRRCGWVFLRVEWETIKRQRANEWLRKGNRDNDEAGSDESEVEEVRLEMSRLG